MSVTTLPRGQITTHLVGVLGSLAFPVGDADTPTESHGWQGEPNSAGTNFIPWVTLQIGNSTNSSGPQASSQADWRTQYYLTTSGVTRKQTEGVADLARATLQGVARELVSTTTGDWKIQQVRVQTIGGITKIGQTSPAYFVQTDVLEVWLSKEL